MPERRLYATLKSGNTINGRAVRAPAGRPLVLQPVAGLEDPPHGRETGAEKNRDGRKAHLDIDISDLEEAPAKAADEVNDRVEQGDRLPHRRQHLDRVEAAA